MSRDIQPWIPLIMIIDLPLIDSWEISWLIQLPPAMTLTYTEPTKNTGNSVFKLLCDIGTGYIILMDTYRT